MDHVEANRFAGVPGCSIQKLEIECCDVVTYLRQQFGPPRLMPFV